MSSNFFSILIIASIFPRGFSPVLETLFRGTKWTWRGLINNDNLRCLPGTSECYKMISGRSGFGRDLIDGSAREMA